CLGVSPTADIETIRRAFRALVRRYHPDVGEGSSPQKFRELVEAYETLADPVRRHRYDATLRPAHQAIRPVSENAGPRRSTVEPLIPQRPRRMVTIVRPQRPARAGAMDP